MEDEGRGVPWYADLVKSVFWVKTFQVPEIEKLQRHLIDDI